MGIRKDVLDRIKTGRLTKEEIDWFKKYEAKHGKVKDNEKVAAYILTDEDKEIVKRLVCGFLDLLEKSNANSDQLIAAITEILFSVSRATEVPFIELAQDVYTTCVHTDKGLK